MMWGIAIYGVSTLLSMATMSIGAAILGAVFLGTFGTQAWARLRETVQEPLIRRYLILSLILTLACALSLIAAQLWPLEYNGRQVQVRFFKDMAKVWYLFWPIVLVTALRAISSQARERIIKIWLWVFLVVSVIGVFQHFTGWPREQYIPPQYQYFHATLFLGHHLSVASVWIFPFFVALDLWSRDRSSKFLAACVLLGFSTLILTYSRTLWAALPVGLVIWVLWSVPRRRVIPILVGLVACGVVAYQIPGIQSRVQNTMGLSTRQALWAANLEFFEKRPWTGVGWHHNLELSALYFSEKMPGQSVFVGHAHNNAIEMLASTGLISTLAWLLWCVYVIALIRKSSLPAVGKGLVCAWIVFHLNGLTQVNFWESKVLHQMMWIVAWTLLASSSPSRESTT